MMPFSRTVYALGLIFLAFLIPARAQRFLPDDPIEKDVDSLPIAKPAAVSLSPTWDMIENTFGLEDAGRMLRAQNTNTLGEVPDSSWFTNRIGARDMTPEELARGANRTGGPDTTESLTILGAGLFSFTEGLIVEDSRGDRYYLIFDAAGMPGMATGAAVVANKFFYAAGYNVFPASIAYFDSERANISPDARILQLDGKDAPMDREFLKLFLKGRDGREDGQYRVAAYQIPPGESVGEFKFFGTRSDDPNDIIPHEDRRELRGMGVFASWLNHYNYRAVNTVDRYEGANGIFYLRHYLIDFSTAFGSGNDLDGRLIPKDKQSGNEYVMWGDMGATLKTAASLGIWMRPWMKVEYPYPEHGEVGRFEGDFFQPETWKPVYPNAAYIRMLPDDAFWAAKILARFSDEAIRAIVRTGEYSDPAAEKYLVDTLIKRRDKIITAYFGKVNPLDGFVVNGNYLEFKNLGQEAGLAREPYYEYILHDFDNQADQLNAISDRLITRQPRILLPKEPGDFLMVRIRTRSQEQRGWRKNVDVYIRMTGTPAVVGIEREVGAFVFDRDITGRLVVSSDVEFGGSYQGLSEEQQRLVDDWFRRFNEMTNRQLEPEEGYNNLPLSTRTTFEGVTNALMETELTDASGRDLGLAIDLVAKVESIHGAIQGARGDEQFRIYVELVPDVIDILEASQQFKRGADNTVYHKGYPRNYRQQKGPPSMQISIAEEGTRADIDVDYRSSKIPGALLNGHLTSANSDVRAGNNYAVHSGRWGYFVNWWRGLFGLPFMTEIMSAMDPEEKLIPQSPRKGKDKLEEAMEDWLQAWLIEAKPEQAIAYLAPSCYACMDVWSEDNPVDYGIAPYMLLDAMVAGNSALGRVRDLGRVVQPETLPNPRLREIEHRYSNLFTLYEVPEDLALNFDCARRNSPKSEESLTETESYGNYFGSVFRLKTPSGEKGGWVIFLWARENKQWKILSYMMDPGMREETEVPDTRPKTDLVLSRMQGDPMFLSNATGFFTDWSSGKIDAALDYFAPQSLSCVALNLQGEPPKGDQEARTRLREALDKVYQAFSQAKDIESFVQPVGFVHPDIRIVEPSKETRISVGGLPDHMGAAYSCDKPLTEVVWQSHANKIYGNYYTTALRLNLVGEDSAALYLLWARVGDAWKIVAFYTLAA
ncbi:MAG: hypothetical protein P8Z37_05905 [Acidobacteriota bacterium]